MNSRGDDSYPVVMRTQDGAVLKLNLDRWFAPVDRHDRSVLERAVAPVIDVGCGPGRHLAALCGRGLVALGVDVAPTAVRVARAKGAPVLQRSVFDRLPGEGRWRSVLLLDGSIGIGGCPARLLRRISQLISPSGQVLVEVERPGAPSQSMTVRLERGSDVGPWFPWATVGITDLSSLASRNGCDLKDGWRSGNRWFGRLEPMITSSRKACRA